LEKIIIPTGIIRTVNKIIDSCKLSVIVDDPTLWRNVAYTFQFIDFIDWLLYRTNIGLIAKEQTIKYGIVAVNSIIEGIVYNYLKRYPAVQPKEKESGKNLEKLEQKHVPRSIIEPLKKVHKKREKIHLRLWGTRLEHQKYKTEDYESAKKALDDFMKWLYKARE